MPEVENRAKSSAGKTKSHQDERFLQDLFNAFQKLQNSGECARFFEDLCTPAELRSMADRWRVAQLLEQGLSYRLINEKTGVSTATITRVARSLSYGTGGYQMILQRPDGDSQ
ncbi:MAG: YerC/YecD family TrpR-related protein [Proteobacteria bacterium]|nr:YerC/YecD family TrpR-related protein [Pseudomonadota bacterium]